LTYRLTKKNILIRCLFFDGNLAENKKMFRCFAFSKKKKTLSWSTVTELLLGKDEMDNNHLEQLATKTRY